ncbi:hypothetical protein DIPPA_24490 [Diplonema papillatum]|nr:hypothetical protein DIPPA_24490 [Diplonema papillatum]
MKRAGLLLLTCSALLAECSPATVSLTVGHTAYDVDCPGEDVQKQCDLTEDECVALCSERVECSAVMYNYQESDPKGANPHWDDGCCWLKAGCPSPKPMEGKKRVVVRSAVHPRPKVDVLTEHLTRMGLGTQDGVTKTVGAMQGSAKEKAASVHKWIEKTEEAARLQKEKRAAAGRSVGSYPFAIPKLA